MRRSWAMRVGRSLGLLVAAALLAGAGGDFVNHSGELLVADRSMQDPRFRQSVILMLKHGPDGAMGLIVNKTLGEAPLSLLLPEAADETPGLERPVPMHYGGPVAPRKGFVLHSPEVAVDGTMPLQEDYALTVNPEMLERIAGGRGPERALIALGYAGWGPGQLEGEIARGDWHWAPRDLDLVFGAASDGDKWRRALARRGLDL